MLTWSSDRPEDKYVPIPNWSSVMFHSVIVRCFTDILDTRSYSYHETSNRILKQRVAKLAALHNSRCNLECVEIAVKP